MNASNSMDYKGFVLSESLIKPTILNNYHAIYVKVEEHNDPIYPLYWHLFKLKINEYDIEEAVNTFCNCLKEGWYAHFWNEKYLFVCFYKKSFKVDRTSDNYSDEIKKVKDFAGDFGVESLYLDFYFEE